MTDSLKKVFTPFDARWSEFAERLEGEECCHFHYDENRIIVWSCFHDYRFATSILEKFGDVDIPATLKLFAENGGHCDCEIVFNVEECYRWTPPDLPLPA